jgi:hypothetical protein
MVQAAMDVVVERAEQLPSGLTLARGKKPVTMVKTYPDRPDRIRERHRPTISGTFELNGGTISFEVIRGNRMPKGERPKARDSKWALDVCFKDSQGRPFLMQIGGDDSLDPTCDPELEEEPPVDSGAHETSPTAEERAASFSVAEAAIATLQGLQFKRRFVEEYEALVGMGHLLERAQAVAQHDCNDENVICLEDDHSSQLGAASITYSWQHILEVWSGALGSNGFFVPLHVGTHGATIAFRRNPRTRRVQAAWRRCNHGKCPHQHPMEFRCAFMSGFSRRYHIHKEYCTTSYSPRSGADWWWRGHNCNDDVYMQYRAVKLNRHAPSGWGTGYPCDDRYTHNYTDWCW